jgi:hypothetical protein
MKAVELIALILALPGAVWASLELVDRFRK